MGRQENYETPEENDEEMTVTLDLDDGTSVTCAIVRMGKTMMEKSGFTVTAKMKMIPMLSLFLTISTVMRNMIRLQRPLMNIWIMQNLMRSWTIPRKTDITQETGQFPVPFSCIIQKQLFSGSCYGNIQEPSFFFKLFFFLYLPVRNNSFIQIR